jgi:hypothetical protein
MVRSALVVSVTSRAGACAGRFLGALPAAASTSADGSRAGEQSDERADGVAAGAAAVVRDALVVSTGRCRDDAPIDDAGRATSGSERHDAPSTGDTARYDAAATSGGHVFCLTAQVKTTRWGDAGR